MAYFLNLFSPETYEVFTKSNRDVSGFRSRQQNAARRIKIGDKLICYMTKLSRWVGVLEVLSELFRDDALCFMNLMIRLSYGSKSRHLLGCQKRKRFPFVKREYGEDYPLPVTLNQITHIGQGSLEAV